MKKIITPIINLAFLFPMTFITMGSIELVARSFGLIPDYISVFKIPFIFIIISVIVISGIPLFWLANRFIQELEKLKSTTIYDHFRQSIFFYLIIAYSLGIWVFSGFKSEEDDVYFLTFLVISIVSIVINLIFLFLRHKLNYTKRKKFTS